MTKNGGMIAPSMEKITPGTPHNLYPITIAPLTATAPGDDWAIAIRSSISFSSIQCRLSTNFVFIRETITYPPPNVKVLR